MSGISGFFGGIGRTGLVALVSVGLCALSIGLNRWLIFGGLGVPALGIHGAGLATLLASCTACLVWLGFFLAPATRSRFATWRARNCDPARLRRFARYALPRGATEILEMLGFLVFTAAITRLSTMELAANNLAFSLYLVVAVPVIGFCQGLAIAVGQALGAGRPDLVRAATRRALLLVLLVLGTAAIVAAWCPGLVIALYAPAPGSPAATDWPAIAALAGPLLSVMALALVADGVQFVYRMAVQGAGDTRWPFAVLTVCALLLMGLPSLAIAHWFHDGLGPISTLHLCWLVMAGYVWIIAAIMAWRFLRGPWPGMSVRA